MKIIVIEAKYRIEIIERDFELEKIKLEIACLANKKLREMFPENYESDSIVKIFIDISSDPMEIMATINSAFSEGKIGKIKLNQTKANGEYSVAPIIMIWARPFKNPLMALL